MEGDGSSAKNPPPLPWQRTVAVQALLCLALYAAFSLGERQLRPPPPMPRGNAAALGGGGDGTEDVYFLSVGGGARPPAAQAQLLKQMENMAKMYKAKFVLDVAQFGEEDVLWQNGSLYFQALKIPWYSTTASQGQIIGNFVKKIKMPYEQVLDIIGVDTGPLQELIHDGKRSTIFREQIEWLEQTLTVTSSNWRIVVGFDPLMICDKVHTTERMKFYESFQCIFVKHAVNVYLSTTGCSGYFYQDNSILYIGNPGPGDQTNEALSGNKQPDFTSEIHNGFLLHRVSPLEIESHLINSEGKVVLRSVAHQNGRGTL